jgi:outer membrane protein TolC
VPQDIQPANLNVNINLDNMAKQHPYYQQYVWTCQSRELSLLSAQANQGPSVFANANYGLSDSQFFPQNNNWSLGLSASYPLWDWGSRQAQTNIAASQLRETDFSEDNALRTVQINLETAQINYLDAVNTLAVQKEYLKAAEERSKIAEAQYSTGQLNYDNWMIIENNFISSQRNVVNAVAAVLSAEAAWIEAKGGTLDEEQ